MSNAAELKSQYGQLADEYLRTSDIRTLWKAHEVIQDAVNQTASGHSRALYLANLGYCHGLLFSATSDLEHLHKAIEAGHESIRAIEAGHESIRAIEAGHESTPAIEAGRESTCATPILSQICATNLSDSLASLYFAAGARDGKDLQYALEMAQRAVDSNHEDCPSRDNALATLAWRLGEYYRFFSGDCYLDKAIIIGRELASKPSDWKAFYAWTLGVHLKIRHDRYGMMEDLMAAKTFSADALNGFPKGHIHRVKVACLLANCQLEIAAKTNEARCLDEISAMLMPLEREAERDEDLSLFFLAKSRLYERKFRMSQTLSNLDMAIEAAKEALKWNSLDGPDRGRFLRNMAACLYLRAAFAMSQEDIDAAVEYAKEYLVLATYTPGLLSDAHSIIGSCLWEKYKLFGGLANLTASVDAGRNQLRLLSEDSASRPKCLHVLAVRLGQCFDLTFQKEVLNEAIQLEREAASKLKGNDYMLYSQSLTGLGTLLSRRGLLTGNMQDFHEAVSAMEKAVALVGSSDYRCVCLHNLSGRLLDRYESERNIEDLDRAIAVILEALSANGGDKSRQLILQNTYAIALCHNAKEQNSMHDLDLAIATQREIVANTPKSSPLMVRVLCNLGLSLKQKYFQIEDWDERLETLREAHNLAEQCVTETPEDHPQMPLYLQRLALWQELSIQFMDQSDVQLHHSQMRLSATTFERGFRRAYLSNGISNGVFAGRLYMKLKEWDAAGKILLECVNMLHRLSPMSLSEDDRQRQLLGFSGISEEACASFLAQGRAEQGIELLEAGRGIMAKIAMRVQDDFPAVKEADASLHARYIQVRQALSQPLVPSSFSHFQDVVAERNLAMKEFEEIEDLIRAIPGFEKFNQGLSSKEMRALAVHGPLVAFCTVDQQCDALIVTTKAIQALPLPALNLDEIKRHIELVVGASRLSKASPTKQAFANIKMRALLSWLWDAAVSPVLEHLGLTQSPANEPQTRLWWITSGPMGLLPLHAAGKGNRQPEQNVFAQVISSYTSSFEALAFARERQSKLRDIGRPRIALITMPQTPGRLADLDTDAESHAICEVFKSMDSPSQSDQVLELRQRSVEEVVKHLQSRTVDIFHFACHAEPNSHDPSKTSLLLGSDPTALAPDALPIHELRKFYGSSPHANGLPPRLVYLSACCTAQQYELQLIDENIHLAAAFQLLGFPAVVGTLWEADDSAAVVVARNFYHELFRLDELMHHGASQFPPQETMARALHSAVSTYRQQKTGRRRAVEDVLLWANFVHIGA